MKICVADMSVLSAKIVSKVRAIYFYVIGVVHWGRFFEGWEQCLQSRLGLVVISRLVVLGQQNIKYV